MCRCERSESIDKALPGEEVLARHSTENCCVVRVGREVIKYLRPATSIRAVLAKVPIAAAHPDLFAPIAVDATSRTIRQPFIEGRHPTADEASAVYAALRDRRVREISDLPLQNMIVDRSGRCWIVDFDAGTGMPGSQTRYRPNARRP